MWGQTKDQNNQSLHTKIKNAKTDTSASDGIINALKKLDTLYNLTMPRIYEPLTKRKYKVTG